jgi:hypothetical protein
MNIHKTYTDAVKMPAIIPKPLKLFEIKTLNYSEYITATDEIFNIIKKYGKLLKKIHTRYSFKGTFMKETSIYEPYELKTKDSYIYNNVYPWHTQYTQTYEVHDIYKFTRIQKPYEIIGCLEIINTIAEYNIQDDKEKENSLYITLIYYDNTYYVPVCQSIIDVFKKYDTTYIYDCQL